MKLYKIFILACVLMLTSCESIDLDLQDDPNNLTLEQSSAVFLLNEVQLDFRGIINGLNGPTLGVMRMDNQFGTYANAIDNLTLNGASGEWAQAYQMRANVQLIKDIADSDPNYTKHYAIARIIEAYTFVTLVDFVGDIPFEQANKPIEFPNPEVSLGEDIYDAMFSQLDEAIAMINTASTEPVQDLFYDGSPANWIKVANTLKFKMFLNLRLIDETTATNGITALMNNADLIENEVDDFEFAYSTANTPVESRHPLFRDGYLAGGADTYMSNSFMNQLINGKTNPDPRLRYYIYRQIDRDPDHPNNAELPCSVDASILYCYLGNYYWGRDHADEEGIPADGSFRATYGIYPAGGAFDDDAAIQAVDNTGNGGAGILPILSSTYLKFMMAESALELNTSGSAHDLLIEGITSSMNKVTTFATVPAAFAATPSDIQDYIDEVSLEYTNASDDNERLDIIMREYYLASFGYSIEAYNGYRRTGFPGVDVLQDPVRTTTGFPRNFRYPRSAVQANTSLENNTVFDKVFWDNNPDDFIQ